MTFITILLKKCHSCFSHQHHILQSHFLNLVSPGDTRPAVQGIAVTDSQEARLVSGTPSWWRPVRFQRPPHPHPRPSAWLGKTPLCMAGQDPLRLMFLFCFISSLKSLLLFIIACTFYLRFVRYVPALFLNSVFNCLSLSAYIFTSLFLIFRAILC
jgi:hypothetical protein